MIKWGLENVLLVIQSYKDKLGQTRDFNRQLRAGQTVEPELGIPAKIVERSLAESEGRSMECSANALARLQPLEKMLKTLAAKLHVELKVPGQRGV